MLSFHVSMLVNYLDLLTLLFLKLTYPAAQLIKALNLSTIHWVVILQKS